VKWRYRGRNTPIGNACYVTFPIGAVTGCYVTVLRGGVLARLEGWLRSAPPHSSTSTSCPILATEHGA
jgi:hypothetical protein